MVFGWDPIAKCRTVLGYDSDNTTDVPARIYLENYKAPLSTSGAIQQAINDAASLSTGGEVLIPRGTFDLAGVAVIMRSGVHLRGVGPLSVITSSVLMDVAIINDTTSDLSNVSFTNITFAGGAIDDVTGPRRGRTSTPSIRYAIKFVGDLALNGPTCKVKDVRIKDCHFRNTVELPVHLSGVRGESSIKDSHFENCKDIGFTWCESIIFNDNHVSKSADNGVSISRGCANAVITGNNISNSAYAGIWIAGWEITGGSAAGPINFNCSGNTIIRSGMAGIKLTDGPQNGTITNNTIVDVFRGPSDQPNNGYGVGITISSFPGSAYPASDATILQYARNLQVSNNDIIRAQTGGIYMRGLIVGKFSNNTMTDIGTVYRADGTTLVPDNRTENFGISLDSQSGATIQYIDITNNKVIDTRVDGNGNLLQITNYPYTAVGPKFCKFSGNEAFNTQKALVQGIIQDAANTNIIEPFQFVDYATMTSTMHATFSGGIKAPGAWNGGHFEISDAHVWKTSGGNLLAKIGAVPTAESDGKIFVFRKPGVIYTTNETLIDVTDLSRLELAQTVVTTVTGFSSGFDGQRLLVRFRNSNTTLQHSASGSANTLFLKAKANFAGVLNDNMEFENIGGVWHQI